MLYPVQFSSFQRPSPPLSALLLPKLLKHPSDGDFPYAAHSGQLHRSLVMATANSLLSHSIVGKQYEDGGTDKLLTIDCLVPCVRGVSTNSKASLHPQSKSDL